MEKMGELRKQKHDLFVSIDLDNTLPISDASGAIALLDQLAGRDTLRLEPPVGRNPFYKAFLPREDWRKRTERISQPLELLVELKEGKATGTLTHIKQVWKPGVAQPELTISEVPIDSAVDLKTKAAQFKSDLPVLLIFAPAAAPVGPVLDLIAEVREDFPILYFYSGKPE